MTCQLLLFKIEEDLWTRPAKYCLLPLKSLENVVGLWRHFWSSWCNNFVLRDMGIKSLHQTPYSPGLDPCAFQLFPKLKDKLRVSCFEDIELMKEAVTRALDTVTLTSWGIYEMVGAIQKVHWSQRMLRSEDATLKDIIVVYFFEMNKSLFWKLQIFCKAPSRLDTSIIASCVRYFFAYTLDSWPLPKWFLLPFQCVCHHGIS